MQRTTIDQYDPWVPFLLIAYNFCANLTNDIYLPSMPRLERVFSASPSMLQLTMTAWFAGVAIPQLFLGPLSDRYGRRPILFWGGICFLIATFACGAAQHVWMLILARFFQGVGVCSLNVVTFAILVDLYNYKTRTQLMSKISTVGILAPLIGPVLGGYVLLYFGWRFNFGLVFIIGLLSLIGLWFKLPESNLILNPSATHQRVLVKTYTHLIKQAGFLKNLLPYCLILGGLVAYLTAAPFIIIQKLKVPSYQFGYTQIPIFTAFILGSVYLNRLKDEEKIKKLLGVGIFLVWLGCGLMLVGSYFFGNNLLIFIIPMILYAFGFSLCGSPLVNEVMSAGMAAKGSASAMLGFGMAMSCMLSSLSVGLIYNGTIFLIALLIFSISLIAKTIFNLKEQAFTVERVSNS